MGTEIIPAHGDANGWGIRKPADPNPLAALPQWQLRYLIARQHIPDDDQAARRAKVSTPIVKRACEESPAFNAAVQAVVAGTLEMGNDEATRLARAAMPHLAQHAIERATHEGVLDRDQARWVQIAGEFAGALGGQAQQASGAARRLDVSILARRLSDGDTVAVRITQDTAP